MYSLRQMFVKGRAVAIGDNLGLEAGLSDVILANLSLETKCMQYLINVYEPEPIHIPLQVHLRFRLFTAKETRPLKSYNEYASRKGLSDHKLKDSARKVPSKLSVNLILKVNLNPMQVHRLLIFLSNFNPGTICTRQTRGRVQTRFDMQSSHENQTLSMKENFEHTVQFE